MFKVNVKNDFFFGEVKFGENGGNYDLYRLIDLAKNVSSEYFTAQINRLLSELKGNLIINHGSSHPPFEELLSKIDPDTIGKIQITDRDDINSNVKATLQCSIWLPDGAFHIQAHWCAYKEIRSGEIVSTLLKPIHLMGLENKTFFEDEPGELRNILSGNDYDTELNDIFCIAGYPRVYTYDDEAKDAMKYYISQLDCATKAFKKHPEDYDAAADEYNKLAKLAYEERTQ